MLIFNIFLLVIILILWVQTLIPHFFSFFSYIFKSLRLNLFLYYLSIIILLELFILTREIPNPLRLSIGIFFSILLGPFVLSIHSSFYSFDFLGIVLFDDRDLLFNILDLLWLARSTLWSPLWSTILVESLSLLSDFLNIKESFIEKDQIIRIGFF